MEKETLLLELHFPSRAERLQAVRNEVRETMSRIHSLPCDVDCAVIAINEACMNIIQHAYGAQQEGKIILQIFDLGDDLLFRLIDFASPVDTSKIKPRDLEDIKPGGLGVHMIHEVMDECRFLKCPEGVGNIFQMRKRKTRNPEQ
ncbi:MAG TPA: ATP-binding protein [Chromatiales bacterium]|nr:ATP-binding protein [Chromatiales bacterium]